MLAAMVISGTIGLFVLLSGQAPLNVVFFRCLLGSIGLSTYCLYRGYFKKFHLNKKQYINLFLGAITLIANWYFLFTGYKLTSVGITTVVYNTQPFLLLIAGFIFRRERPTKSALLWLCLAFTGLVVLAQPNMDNHNPHYLQGIFCALTAAALYAITTLLTKSLSTAMRPELIAVGHMTIGTLVFIPIANFGQLPTGHVQILSIVILGLVHSTFMYILLYGAFQKASTSSIAVLGFAYPLVAVIVDFVAFGKVLTGYQFLGGVLIVASAVAYAMKIDIIQTLRNIRKSEI